MPDGFWALGDASGGVFDEQAAISAHTAAATRNCFGEGMGSQGLNVGGVTSVLPAMIRPILIKAGLLALSQ
ncbi:hypothetical protein MALV_08180 [Mycolicibacterium alvei]|uniref:Uncharacterized protein n=1 Tax=Mycolicibacterium alvei TaxID=67081 RepID=A0A6N4UPA4_9MYCO|nr:hypothetical protein MALV_08180 [Mycolicibacterium alvei]